MICHAAHLSVNSEPKCLGSIVREALCQTGEPGREAEGAVDGGEDEKLRALIAKARAKRQAVSWADIARKLPGRSDQQVKGHWERYGQPSLPRSF